MKAPSRWGRRVLRSSRLRRVLCWVIHLYIRFVYAANRWTVLWKLRFPTALPYLFSALKVSATASIVGAIIGESPSSIAGGLGGAILNFAQYYSFQPQNLWATNIVAAALGVAFFLVVVGAEKLVVRRAPEHVA